MNDAYEPAELEAARKLFLGPVDFTAGAATSEQLPLPVLLEVAFAGRSNVGKSSLINALTGRKALARTSSTPGRTQQINFFDLGGVLGLVDLPGYGYARVSKSKVLAWTETATLYLKGRVGLKRVFVLIDCRRGIGDSDIEIMSELDKAAVSYQIVLTKCDKISETKQTALIAQTALKLAKHPAAHPEILTSSADKGAGIAELRAVIAALAAPKQLG
ncbi:MAG: ribosome biogenesis GTP-binding protein YihA/YsxC [Alphaproteobacteria bacterium]|jgi:GTP-binding protein